MDDTILRDLRTLFSESLHIEAPAPDVDLFESGTLDSLQLIELMVQLERRFGVAIAIESIDLEDLRTLARIARLVAASAGGTSQAEPGKRVANG